MKKKRILENDYNFNNSRSDYCVKSYQRGMSWDKFSLKNDYRKWIPTLSKFLNKILSIYIKKLIKYFFSYMMIVTIVKKN
jgi:hypothetical protein